MTQAAYVLLALGLVLLNAFFVATEFAIVRIRKTRIDELVSRGVSRAKAAQEVIRNLNAYLSACQFGITLASLGLGWVGEPAFARLIEPLFAPLGAAATTATHSVALTLAFLLITLLHIVFGELAPKTLAIERTEPVALWVALPIRAFTSVFYPVIWALNETANLAVRAIGLEPLPEHGRAHSEEELRLILGSSLAGGMLSGGHARLLTRALDFPAQTVRQIMVPRADVVYLDLTGTPERIREVALRSGHTRYPLCDGDLDRIVGVIHIKDLFLAAPQGGEPVDLSKLAREPLLVPESLQVGRLLELFRNSRRHLCIVIDEYGGTSGIATLEDVLEELTGEIQDEFDREVPKVQDLADGRLSVDATLPVGELQEVLGIEVVDEEVDTLGGLVVARLGRLARVGDVVELDGRRIEVARVRGRRILRLTVHPPAAAPPAQRAS
jgi:CBS domain containing-hemolysin-like protein